MKLCELFNVEKVWNPETMFSVFLENEHESVLNSVYHGTWENMPKEYKSLEIESYDVADGTVFAILLP